MGEVRYSSGALPTDYTYTGQYSNTADFGLMYYRARWYDPSLGRFSQADTVVPGAMAIDFDRYAYVRNSPTGAVDPSGHFCVASKGGGQICSADDDNPSIVQKLVPSLPMPRYPISDDDLIWIALAVFSETKNGADAYEVIFETLAWAFFNILSEHQGKDAYSVIFNRETEPFNQIGRAFQGENTQERLKAAINCYSNTTFCPKYASRFQRVFNAVKKAYKSYITGKTDPTNGSTMFALFDVQSTGVTFDNIHDVRASLSESFSIYRLS